MRPSYVTLRRMQYYLNRGRRGRGAGSAPPHRRLPGNSGNNSISSSSSSSRGDARLQGLRRSLSHVTETPSPVRACGKEVTASARLGLAWTKNTSTGLLGKRQRDAANLEQFVSRCAEFADFPETLSSAAARAAMGIRNNKNSEGTRSSNAQQQGYAL
eukprot:gene5144-biopygen4049